MELSSTVATEQSAHTWDNITTVCNLNAKTAFSVRQSTLTLVLKK